MTTRTFLACLSSCCTIAITAGIFWPPSLIIAIPGAFLLFVLACHLDDRRTPR